MGRCVGFTDERTLSSYVNGGSEEANKKKSKKVTLPCYPATVVYGHSASRGLSPKRWSVGLDSGCVYGRKLTALVLGGPRLGSMEKWEVYEEDDEVGQEEGESEDEMLEANDDRVEDSDSVGRRTNANRWRRRKHKKKDGDIVPFGDQYKAKILSIKCR